MVWIKARGALREEERKLRAIFAAATVNVHLPKKSQIQPHDLYGEAPKPKKLTREDFEALKSRFGPEAIPVDMDKLHKQRRLN